jgi:hypothetical protein
MNGLGWTGLGWAEHEEREKHRVHETRKGPNAPREATQRIHTGAKENHYRFASAVRIKTHIEENHSNQDEKDRSDDQLTVLQTYQSQYKKAVSLWKRVY